MNPIIIVSAIPEEINSFLNHYPNIQKKIEGPFTFHHTQHKNHPLVLTTSGVGKVFAAMTTQKLIDRYHPRLILFTGLAGALNPNYAIGDLIIATSCIQYDIDASEMGFPRGNIPYTDYHTFIPDSHLVELAQQSAGKHPTYLGRILTGDLFMTQTKRNQYADIFTTFKGDAIEMEGAALAHVCTHNQTPYLLIRTISDKANTKACTDFMDFLKTASQTSFRLIQNFLDRLN